MKRTVLALAFALVALVAAAGPASAKGDEPLGDGSLARVQLGVEGFIPRLALTPVAVTIKNPENRERTFRIFVTPRHGESAEETVTVGPLARKRIAFALRVSGAVSVSLAEGESVLARGTFTGSPMPEHVVLLIDGDPDTLQVPEVATGCIVIACGPEELSSELLCLARFNAIVLRSVDPSRIETRARAALDDYVRSGGWVAVVAADERPALRALYDACDPTTERADGPFARRRRGLGTVVHVAEDVGANATSAQAKARGALGALCLARRRIPAPRAHLGEHPNDTALSSGILVTGFVILYALVAGPVFALVTRKRKPRVVLRALGGVLLAFVALAALVAVAVRSGSSVVNVLTFVVVPKRGEPVVLTDITLQSAGRRTQDVTIEGDDLSATSYGRAGRHFENRYWTRDPEWYVDTARTEHRPGRRTIAFAAHPLPSFGETCLSAIAAAPGWKRIPAAIARGQRGRGDEVVIANTLDHDLGAVAVIEATPRHGAWQVARADALPRGASVALPLRRVGSLAPTLIHLPPFVEVVNWLSVAPETEDGTDARFVLYVEEPAPLVVKASGARIVEHAWRIQDVDAPAATVPGWLGVTVKKTERGLKIVAVAAGSPAASESWFFTPGRIITSVDGIQVRTPEDLERALIITGPGALVRVRLDQQQSNDIELGDVPKTPPRNIAEEDD